jgi:hypothetical protein
MDGGGGEEVEEMQLLSLLYFLCWFILCVGGGEGDVSYIVIYFHFHSHTCFTSSF